MNIAEKKVELNGALARGYASKENEKKVTDTALLNAISAEVWKWHCAEIEVKDKEIARLIKDFSGQVNLCAYWQKKWRDELEFSRKMIFNEEALEVRVKELESYLRRCRDSHADIHALLLDVRPDDPGLDIVGVIKHLKVRLADAEKRRVWQWVLLVIATVVDCCFILMYWR